LSKETLNEDQMLAAIMDAQASGDSLALSKLMSEEHTTLVSAPSDDDPVVPKVEDEPVLATTVVPEVKSADEPAAKDGTPPGTPEKKEEVKNTGPAWLEALPETIKDQVLKDFQDLYGKAQHLEHYQRSNEGRVSALQKKADMLQRELDSRRQTEPVKAPAPSSTKLEESPALKKLKEEDPALYEVHKSEREELLKQTREEIEKAKAEFNSALDKQLQPIQKAREAEYIRQQQDIVLNTIPNAREVVSSPYWKEFEDNAPAGVRALINSDAAEDVIAAFELYNSWAMATFPPEQKAPVETPAAPAPKVTDPNTAKLEEERQRKLKAGAPANKGPSPSAVNITDHDAALEEVFQKRWKEMGFK
jgi:hypothetical protein